PSLRISISHCLLDGGAYARAEPDGTLLHLPAFELEDALYRVFVNAQQIGDRPIPKRRRLFDHRFDGLCQFRFDLRRGLRRFVVHRAPGNTEPLAQLGDRDGIAIFLQSLADRLDHFSSSPNRDCNFFLARNSNIASPYASCKSLIWRSYCSLTSSGLALNAFSIPRL